MPRNYSRLLNEPLPLRSLIAKLMVGGCLGLSQFLLLTPPAIAEITQATITEIIRDAEETDTEVLVESSSQPTESATVGETVEFQETVRTENARAALTFDNGAVGRLDRNSSITVGQCIEVRGGSLMASGPANGCTASFAVGVQGTIYAIAMIERDDERLQRIQVLEGDINITLSDPDRPSDPTAKRVEQVMAGEQLLITPDGRIQDRRFLTREEMEIILEGGSFEGFEEPLPNSDRLQQTLLERFPNIRLPKLPGFRTLIRGLF